MKTSEYNFTNAHKLKNISDKKQDYRNLIAGFISSMISRTLCAPLDRLKMIYQVHYFGNNPPSMRIGLYNIYQKEGVLGYFRGNFINVMKGSPETAIRLYCYELIKWKLQCYHNQERLSNLAIMLTGALSGVVATALIFPLEVIKLRIGVTDRKNCIGIYNTIRMIYNEPRGIINFYSGLEASIISAIPNNGLLLYSYEKLKCVFSGQLGADNASFLSTQQIIFISGVSAMISSTILYPFQIVQARMIMHNVKKNQIKLIEPTVNNKGIIGVGLKKLVGLKFSKSFYTILKVEGLKGFYKGYCPAVAKMTIGNGTGFGIYEKTKEFLGVNK